MGPKNTSEPLKEGKGPYGATLERPSARNPNATMGVSETGAFKGWVPRVRVLLFGVS